MLRPHGSSELGNIRLTSVSLAAALVLGIWLGDALQITLWIPVLTTACGWLVLAILRFSGSRLHPFFFSSMALFACCSFGMLRVRLEAPENRPGHYVRIMERQTSEQQDHTRPKDQTILIRLQERLRPTSYSRRWTAHLVQLGSEKAKGRVLVPFPSDASDGDWLPGDEILLLGNIEPFHPPRNPGQFDYGSFMRYSGIPGRIRMGADAYWHRSIPAGGIGIRIDRLRIQLSKMLVSSGLSQETAVLSQALLLGERSGLDSDLRAAYQRAGVVHLLAISGLHVGMVLALVHGIFALLPVRIRPGLRFAVSILALWGYALLVGLGPSVVRASLMFSLWALALYVRREGESMHFLGIAALLMLGLLNPYWMFQAGFQLSFAAVWGILAFAPVFRSLGSWKGQIPKKVWAWIAVSLSAQLGVLPWSLYHFHQFPWMFLLGSLLLVPLMPVILGLGFAHLFLSATGWKQSWVSALLNGLLEGQNYVVRILASWEGFLVEGIRWDKVHFCLAYGLLLGLYLAFRKPSGSGLRKKSMALAACFLLALQSWSLWSDVQSSQKRQWVVPHQTGGSSFWFREGSHLYLFGESPMAHRQAQDFLQSEGLDTILPRPMGDAYVFGRYRILRVTQDGKYPVVKYAPEIVLLSGSPHIHLERMLRELRPMQVIADGSNYFSDLDRWARSCSVLGIPFHATARDGAFIKDLE